MNVADSFSGITMRSTHAVSPAIESDCRRPVAECVSVPAERIHGTILGAARLAGPLGSPHELMASMLAVRSRSAPPQRKLWSQSHSAGLRKGDRERVAGVCSRTTRFSPCPSSHACPHPTG
jgi:hypothetical protein